MRALAQSLAREFGPKGVHVVHAIIDGVIDIERTKEWKFEHEDAKIKPESVRSRSARAVAHADNVADCRLVLASSHPAPIVLHQRDRHPALRRKVVRRWCGFILRIKGDGLSSVLPSTVEYRLPRSLLALIFHVWCGRFPTRTDSLATRSVFTGLFAITNAAARVPDLSVTERHQAQQRTHGDSIFIPHRYWDRGLLNPFCAVIDPFLRDCRHHRVTPLQPIAQSVLRRGLRPPISDRHSQKAQINA